MLCNDFSRADRFYFHNHNKFDEFAEPRPFLHHHDAFEIYFITAGNCTYFVDNRCYKMIPGDVIIIPEGVIHNTEYNGNHHLRLLINCSRQFIPASVISVLPSIGNLYRNSDIRDELMDIFKKIEEEYTRADNFSTDILRCYTYMLFFLMARNKNQFDKSTAGNKYVERAISYIQNNFSNNISLSEISEVCSIHPEYFSRMFKKETGFGFCEYVNTLRLQKAESLLKQHSKMSVTEIAAECGFDDSNYFSVKFKKMYGMPPKKMQLQYNK